MPNPAEHILWMLIVAIVCAGASIVLAYMARWQAVIAAFAALVLAWLSGYVWINTGAVWFWGAATAIACGIALLLPQAVRDARAGVAFFATGAMAGAVLGMLTNTVAGVILCSAAAVVLASLAFARTPAGAAMGAPSRKYFNYLCAKGLPLVVTFSMLGIVCLQLLTLGGRL